MRTTNNNKAGADARLLPLGKTAGETRNANKTQSHRPYPHTHRRTDVGSDYQFACLPDGASTAGVLELHREIRPVATPPIKRVLHVSN